MKRLASILALALIASAGSAAAAQGTYTIDTVHSTVSFKIRHLVAKAGGTFDDFGGVINMDLDNLDNSSVEFTIQAASIDTANQDRDKHLRSEDFFFVEKHPEISFRSTKITKVDEDTYAVTGILTMRGVGNPVTLNVDYLGEMQAMGSSRAGFQLDTTIDRKDWDIIWNKNLDAGGVLLGDDVDISITLAAVQKLKAE
jgi:polyisoprenoid-binding protein YceI